MSGIDGSMFELFREEVKAHADTLTAGLIVLETNATDPTRIEPLMRAAHSIKGAARIVGIDTAVRLAHVMEDAFVAAQNGVIRITPADIDIFLKGTDLLAGLALLTPGTVATWESTNTEAVDSLETQFLAMAEGNNATPASTPAPASVIQNKSPSTTSAFPPLPSFTPATISTEPFALASDHSMFDLFREEARGHLASITKTLDTLLSNPTASEPTMESLKQLRGAAKLVKCEPVAALATALSNFLGTARDNKSELTPSALDWSRYAVATLAGMLTTNDETFPAWVETTAPTLAGITEAFAKAVERRPPPPTPLPAERGEKVASTAAIANVPPASHADSPLPAGGGAGVGQTTDAVVRVAAQSLNRLMGLAGESLVQARWLPVFSTALFKLKKQHDRLAALLDTAYNAATGGMPSEQLVDIISDARRQWTECRQDLNTQTTDFDEHAARAEDLNARLYREVIISRMRPFGDGVHGLPRLVRDMARSLGKEARVVIIGDRTEVDRDILERLESPLSHLVRNAVDHGLEMPQMRTIQNKPAVGTVTVEARHRSGMLHVSVSDDGAGIGLDDMRDKIVERGMNTAEVVARLTEAELLEFLFLPGFSTATSVTEFSGRGVGLDVVQDTVRKVGGNVRITTASGKGTTFHMQLPLTLSVIRAVIVEVAGEPYAFPHTRIDRLIRVRREEVRSIEHRQFVTVDGANVGLVMAGQILDIPAPTPALAELPVVLLSDGSGEYGLVVDAFRGEQDLVVRPLDSRLGKVPNLGAAAILDDGSPVLIIDVEDLFRSMDQFIQTGSLVRCETRGPGSGRTKRVLVVDDSITVREVERQLLLHNGYEVAVAVDGVEGWNKIRAERYDLLVSDIDMPRMNGLQLVQAVRADDRLRDLPVIIVSYKEREEDRLRGMEVGANTYLTKGSFHDNRFMEAVIDLIGPAEEISERGA